MYVTWVPGSHGVEGGEGVAIETCGRSSQTKTTIIIAMLINNNTNRH